MDFMCIALTMETRASRSSILPYGVESFENSFCGHKRRGRCIPPFSLFFYASQDANSTMTSPIHKGTSYSQSFSAPSGDAGKFVLKGFTPRRRQAFSECCRNCFNELVKRTEATRTRKDHCSLGTFLDVVSNTSYTAVKDGFIILSPSLIFLDEALNQDQHDVDDNYERVDDECRRL